MSGVISTGLGYQERALSGMIRESEQQQAIDQSNKELKARESAARKSNQASMTVAGGMAGAYVGAQYGSVGGPYGAVAGAALGFLFGSLM